MAKDPGYHLARSDIESWEKRNGEIPAGSVVMVRSDWSKRWPDPALASASVFPGVSLAALQFFHEERHILFHGHEPLDTDTTPNLEGEAWLMHHGYAQAEGVANLDKVPEKGCLIAIGFPKFGGGLGGYARYIARTGNTACQWAKLPKRRCPRATRFFSGTTNSASACASSASDEHDSQPG